MTNQNTNSSLTTTPKIYKTFKWLKVTWIQLGKPMPGLVHFIRHSLLGMYKPFSDTKRVLKQPLPQKEKVATTPVATKSKPQVEHTKEEFSGNITAIVDGTSEGQIINSISEILQQTYPINQIIVLLRSEFQDPKLSNYYFPNLCFVKRKSTTLSDTLSSIASLVTTKFVLLYNEGITDINFIRNNVSYISNNSSNVASNKDCNHKSEIMSNQHFQDTCK